jgi:nitrate/TMAO reductase-like tetraheme cytochrome c subunit
MHTHNWMKIARLGMFAVCLTPLAAFADDDAPLPPTQVNAKWQQECGSCHIAYAPSLLPAASWRKVMAGLDKHFGADASVTPADDKEITAYLVKFGSNRWSGAATPLRITETAGFKRSHSGRELPAGVWTRASVKSPGNCQACHSGADKGDFNENSVKIPN